MKNEAPKTSALSEKKDRSEVGSLSTTDNKLVWRKEVSAWARFLMFGLYGLICFSIGKKVMDHSAPFAEIKKKTDELSAKLDAMNEERQLQASFRTVATPSKLSQRELDRLAGAIKTELAELYGARESAGLKVIAQQKERISQLESHLQNLLNEGQTTERVQGVAEHESVPYNQENLSIMRHEFRLKKKRMQEQLEREKEAFIALHDMSIWDNQSKFKKMKDDHQLILYRLDQEFYSDQRQFKERGHRMPASL